MQFLNKLLQFFAGDYVLDEAQQAEIQNSFNMFIDHPDITPTTEQKEFQLNYLIKAAERFNNIPNGRSVTIQGVNFKEYKITNDNGNFKITD